jgi:hypothetical protein
MGKGDDQRTKVAGLANSLADERCLATSLLRGEPGRSVVAPGRLVPVDDGERPICVAVDSAQL